MIASMKQNLGRYMVAEQITATEWGIFNKRSLVMLGALEWYQPWKQWVLSADEDAVFSADCLQDLVLLLARLNERGKPVVGGR